MHAVIAGEEPAWQHTPAPRLASFPTIVQPDRLAEELPKLRAPPDAALFSEKVQSVNVGDEDEQLTPPPELYVPGAWLPANVQLVNVGEDDSWQ